VPIKKPQRIRELTSIQVKRKRSHKFLENYITTLIITLRVMWKKEEMCSRSLWI
jgi:hypothetical protein